MVRIFHQYVSRKTILLIGLESALIAVALLAGVKLRFWNDPEAFRFYTVLPDFAIQALAVMFCFQLTFYYNELYDLHAVWHPSEHLIRLGQSMGAACLLLGLLYFLFPSLIIGRGVFLIALVMVAASVLVTRAVVDFAWRTTAPAENVLIFGTGKLALDIARELTRRSDLKLRLVGFVVAGPADSNPTAQITGHDVLGSADDLESIVESNPVSRLIVATEDRRGTLPVGELLRLRTRGLQVEEGHSTMAALTGRVALEGVRPSWFIFSEGFRRTRLTVALKRAVDLSFGLAGLLLALPFMALSAVIIWLDSGLPVLYRQVRVGLNGRQFELLKFRTMTTDAEAEYGAQWATEDDPRATRVGRYLRRYRLDELPQFVNVIRGDMSFVGPRPERPEFVGELLKQIPYYDERHTVRPGITGWAQVNYPYGASVEDAFRKLEYDLFYLKNMSILFDCAIVFRTVRIVLFGGGAR